MNQIIGQRSTISENGGITGGASCYIILLNIV